MGREERTKGRATKRTIWPPPPHSRGKAWQTRACSVFTVHGIAARITPSAARATLYGGDPPAGHVASGLHHPRVIWVDLTRSPPSTAATPIPGADGVRRPEGQRDRTPSRRMSGGPVPPVTS